MRLAAAVAALVAAAAPGVEVSDFRWDRMLAGAGGGVVAFEPDGPLYAHSKLELADLRVVDADGRQVPWRRRPQGRATNRVEAQLLNAGRRGRGFAALVDLGPRRVVRNRLELSFGSASDFVGEVTVFGSDDRRTFTRLSTTTVYDLRGAEAARSTTLVFPPTDHRFLRLEGRNLPTPDGARAFNAPRAPTLGPVEVRSATTRQDGTRTIVELDVGFEKLPVDVLRFDSATPAFDREVEVLGSNGGAETPLVFGNIVRGPGGAVLTVPVDARHRRLRIVIENADDEPLRSLRVTPLARPRELLLAGGYAPPFRLLYGNRSLDAPEYDFARLPERALPPVTRGSLGAERPNPDWRAPEDTRSFLDRNSWLVEGALVLAALGVAVGGFFALRRRA